MFFLFNLSWNVCVQKHINNLKKIWTSRIHNFLPRLFRQIEINKHMIERINIRNKRYLNDMNYIPLFTTCM